MKNKKLLYILIPAVIFVWGMIVYKIVMASGGNENEFFPIAEFTKAKPNEVLNDTFSIHPDYRDPFSGNQVKKTSISITPGPQKIQKVIAPVAIAKWPEIIYGGIVKNQKSNKQLVLMQVNGQSKMMKVGESVDNIELTKVFRDSIEVKFGKEKRYIKK